MANKFTQSDLNTGHTVQYNKLGTGSKALVGFDHAVVGPLVIQDPNKRVMTGAMSSAQATEQGTLITAAGGMASLIGKVITEAGTKAN